jgi:hypothetical protein
MSLSDHPDMAATAKLTTLLAALQSGKAALRQPSNQAAHSNILTQLRSLSDDITKQPAEPVRTIHHFACTGGTLISRYLAATPNARLLSEIDPLSPLAKNRFSPLDLALQYRASSPVDNEIDQLSIFMAGFEVIYKRTCARGERLILRDHAHSHFCTGSNIPKRPTLKEIIAPHYPLVSVVSVRHPLDSYLSMLSNNFTHFTPLTLDSYAGRYMTFLDKYADETLIKYEEFITNHDITIGILCAQLDLPRTDDMDNIVPGITLTGDSGRKGGKLELRPRREVSIDIAAMCKSSGNYKSLCKRLDYST